jgi:hypothetical protein
VVRHGPLRYAIPPLWIAAAVAATPYVPSVPLGPGALGGLMPRDSAAIRAEREAARLFAISVLSRAVVVQRDSGGLRLDAHQQTSMRGRTSMRSGVRWWA